MRTEIASHRGGALLWPENSLLAFRQSMALRLEQVEFDIHLSADDVPVVIHDAVLDRTTDGHGPVRARTAAELRATRLRGAGEQHVATLEEVAALLGTGRQLLRLEIKTDATGAAYPAVLPRCLAVLDAAGLRERTVIMAFHTPTAAAAAREPGLAGAVWLVERPAWKQLGAAGALEVLRANGVPELGIHQADADAETIAALHADGRRFGVWAANDAASIQRMLEIGVDVFATDDPVLAVRLRG